MSDEQTPKKRNLTGPLPPAQCADRIAKVLAEAPGRIAKKEAEVAAVKVAIAADVRELFTRCTDPGKLPRMLDALDVDTEAAVTGGYWDTNETNGVIAEASPRPVDVVTVPDWANKPPTATSRAVQIDRGAK